MQCLELELSLQDQTCHCLEWIMCVSTPLLRIVLYLQIILWLVYHPSCTFTQYNIPSVSSITSCDLGNSSGSGLMPGELRPILYIALWAESCLFNLECEDLFKSTHMIHVIPVRIPNSMTTRIGSAMKIAFILSSKGSAISAERESHKRHTHLTIRVCNSHMVLSG